MNLGVFGLAILDIPLVVTDGNTVTIIAENSDGFRKLGSQIDLNDSGIAAFFGVKSDGEEGVFLGDGVTISEFATESDGFRNFDGAFASINDSGSVVFSTRDGLFTGPDPTSDIVIEVGDELFGKTIQEISLLLESLNSFGQISFTARFDDGTEAIVRADQRCLI